MSFVKRIKKIEYQWPYFFGFGLPLAYITTVSDLFWMKYAFSKLTVSCVTIYYSSGLISLGEDNSLVLMILCVTCITHGKY